MCTWMTRALAFGAPAGTACSFDSRPPRSTYNEGATARATNHFAQVPGPSAASHVSLTSAPLVPQRAFPLRRTLPLVVPRPNGVARLQRRLGHGRRARGLGRPNAAGAPSIVVPCSTPMTAPRKMMPTPRVHSGIHISAQARWRRGHELMGGRVRTREDEVILPKKRPAKPMGKDRGANAAGYPLYGRAGRGCDRASAACCRSVLLPFITTHQHAKGHTKHKTFTHFTPPGTPAPL